MLRPLPMLRFENVIAVSALLAFVGFAIAGCVEENRKAEQASHETHDARETREVESAAR